MVFKYNLHLQALLNTWMPLAPAMFTARAWLALATSAFGFNMEIAAILPV